MADQIVLFIGWIISFIGIGIIFIASLKALWHFIISSLGDGVGITDIRLELGYSIILGLEFFVAADIIESVFKPSYYDIGLLAAIVVIRTFLSYFLNKELKEIHHEEVASKHD